ncbi:MAG: ATP-binding protein [Gammaproteobacteria bacterium]|nr:MAG: ATP-binding protein [Gammaproteobacteria bacterium]
MSRPIVLSWSTGKDSAWMLHQLNRDPAWRPVGLLSCLHAGEVTMHRVGSGLVAAQARAVGLPLQTVSLPWPCSNIEYEARLGEALAALADAGIGHVAFGDLHLGDIRDYRESLLARHGLEAVFPLWGQDTATLAREMLAGGLQARVVCVDGARLAPALVGRRFDADFLAELPAEIDPCGEFGEFHTFTEYVEDFREPVRVRAGETWQDGLFHHVRLSAA